MHLPMTFGARKGGMNPLKKWLANIAASEIKIFPVPGEDAFRSRGIDLRRQGFDIAANPRQANALAIISPFTEGIMKKAATAFAQMPRPRALIAAGKGELKYLPEPDIRTSAEEAGFAGVPSRIIRLLQNPWLDYARTFAPAFLKNGEKNKDKNGGNHDHHRPETNPHGHDGSGEHEHGPSKADKHHDHHGHPMHEEHGGENDQRHHQMSHEHGGMGFMSMVSMTRNLPRSADGLPMERNEAWFGPFFPGLPGGLALHLTLDGDTVVQAEPDIETLRQDLSPLVEIRAARLPEKIAEYAPLAPRTYRILAEYAMSKIINKDAVLSIRQIKALEDERICSHLNWLASFGKLVGNRWLHDQSSEALYFFLKDEDVGLDTFIEKALNLKYLKKRLATIGGITSETLHHTSGPVARAAGIKNDARIGEPNYARVGFQPLIINENNAWGRYQMRLMEISQSLILLSRIEKDNSITESEEPINAGTGAGQAFIETPRGAAKLELAASGNKIERLELQSPSGATLQMAAELVNNLELSDALAAITSLDIDPYGIT